MACELGEPDLRSGLPAFRLMRIYLARYRQGDPRQTYKESNKAVAGPVRMSVGIHIIKGCLIHLSYMPYSVGKVQSD